MKLIKVTKKDSKKVDAYEEYVKLAEDVAKNFAAMEKSLEKLDKAASGITNISKLLKLDPEDPKVYKEIENKNEALSDIQTQLSFRGIDNYSLNKFVEKYQRTCKKFSDSLFQLRNKLTWHGESGKINRKLWNESPNGL